MQKNMDDVAGLVQGLHHITLVTSNQETNRRFYTEILGLRRVKLTVNQDDIYHRHLFYADEKGTTGSAITFFEWPELPRGRVGLGSPHHISYTVRSLDALPKWKAWLSSQQVPSSGPYLRDGGKVSLYLRDPDGVVVEFTSLHPESLRSSDLAEMARKLPEVHGIDGEMKLTVFHHASPLSSDPELTAKFLRNFVGIERSFQKPNPDQLGGNIVAFGNETHPDFLRYLAASDLGEGEVGRGNIHHIAMAVEEDEDQLKIMRRLNAVGMSNSGIVDRFWFKSLYFRDPDGNLLEIATKKPGYTADEKLEELGRSLVLPAWLEPRRKAIQSYLESTDAKTKGSGWPPSYSPLPSPPESLPETERIPAPA